MISTERLGQHKFRFFSARNQVVQYMSRQQTRRGGEGRGGGLYQELSISEIEDRRMQIAEKKREASCLHAATYLACEKYVLDQRGRIDEALRAKRAKRKRDGRGEIENRLLADNRSFNTLTVATKRLTEALASRFGD